MADDEIEIIVDPDSTAIIPPDAVVVGQLLHEHVMASLQALQRVADRRRGPSASDSDDPPIVFVVDECQVLATAQAAMADILRRGRKSLDLEELRQAVIQEVWYHPQASSIGHLGLPMRGDDDGRR